MEKSRNPFKEKMMDVPNLCVRKLLPEEVPLLTDLYAYRDAEDMIRENTAKIQTGHFLSHKPCKQKHPASGKVPFAGCFSIRYDMNRILR